MLFAFLGPFLTLLSTAGALVHLLVVLLPALAIFTAGYAWRHWGRGWLWFTVPGAPALQPPMSKPTNAPPATAVPAPDGHAAEAVDPLDQLAAATAAVQAQLARDEADGKAASAAAETKAKADAAALEAKRAKLAAIAGALATKPVA